MSKSLFLTCIGLKFGGLSNLSSTSLELFETSDSYMEPFMRWFNVKMIATCFEGLDFRLILDSLFSKLRLYISFECVLCIPSEQILVLSKLHLYNLYHLLSVIKKTPSQTSLKKYWLYWFLLYRMPRCYILKRKRLRLCTIPLLSII